MTIMSYFLTSLFKCHLHLRIYADHQRPSSFIIIIIIKPLLHSYFGYEKEVLRIAAGHRSALPKFD